MEFSNARGSRQRAEGTLPWAKAQHSISNCAPEPPRIWTERGKKKSDNGVIVLAPQAILLFLTPPRAALATGRQRLGLPQGQGTRERACPLPGGTVPRRGCSRHPLFAETAGTSRAETQLVVAVHREPEASTADQLSCCPSNSLTTTLEKQPGSAKTWQSP